MKTISWWNNLFLGIKRMLRGVECGILDFLTDDKYGKLLEALRNFQTWKIKYNCYISIVLHLQGICKNFEIPLLKD